MRNLKQMEILAQAGTACGTTSLAMIIRFLNDNDTLTPADIDREIRRLPGMFSAPADLIGYARRHGLKAEEYNNGSLQHLESLVSRGIPVMSLLDLTPENALDFSQWHWLVVVAVEQTDGQRILVVNNPWGRQEQWEQERFLKEWAYLKLLGLTFGYNNYCIAVGTADDTLPLRRAENTGAAGAVTKGLADILNGFATIKYEKNPSGLGQIIAGVLRLVYGACGLIVCNFLRLVRLRPNH